MQFRTEVEIPKYPFRIGYNTPTLFCGSCFTENIGGIVRALKMPVRVNPFGVIYNPYSIYNSLRVLMANKKYLETDLQRLNDTWFSYDFHTSHSFADKNECLGRINREVNNGHAFLDQLQNLFITFGTARIYRLKANGRVVANCHKVPAGEFSNELMDVDGIVELWTELLNDLISINPTIKVIFTVSPIRHWKDGAAGNQLSKSVLILATHKLMDKFPDNAFYFPGYEIMMDDLRDYRFYDDDMLHPSQKAIEYIWKKFESAFIDKISGELIGKVQKIIQAVNHRPFSPHTSQHQQFIRQTLKSIDLIVKEHPAINFDEELRILKGFIV